MRWLTALALLVFPSGRSTAQQAVPASQAQVRLEVRDGRTQFKIGDEIRLELVFQDSAFPESSRAPNGVWRPLPGQRVVNATDYGDLADKIIISPDRGWFQWQGSSGHDYLMETPLDAKGARVPLVLNQGYVFREPGHYDIAVKTYRLRGETVTTNSVGVDIAARSSEEENALVRTLDAAITSTSGKEQHRAARQLAYLPGDDAARAKVRWILGSDQELAQIMSGGLAATRNQEFQLELLKSAWADPTHAPGGMLQAALQRSEAFAQGQEEAGFVMWGPAPKATVKSTALASEYRADLDRVIATLPQRTGDVRRDTAYYLMQDNSLTQAQLAQIKPVVLEEFPHMEPMAQSMLIETRWNDIRDPSLIPALKAMIESKEKWMDAPSAVERLVEIDNPQDAKPYVIDMICRPQRGLLLDKLNEVKADRIPEVDGCLTTMLAKGEKNDHDFDWEQAAQRAARFATPAILPAIKAAWINASQDASMLAILVRDAPAEAVDLLNREPTIQWFPTNKVYEAAGVRFPIDILDWLRSPQAPSNAVYELAHFGEPEDRSLLESKLTKLRSEWRGRESEMLNAQPGTEAYKAKAQEEDLVSSLLGAKAWVMSTADKQRTTADCLSDWCKRYAPRASEEQ